MSYRTIKRVLGETNLERKCRWWFGVSLFILLTLSFTWYGKRTDSIVQDLNPKFIGPEFVRAGWLGVHLTHLADIARIARDQRAAAAAGTIGTTKSSDFDNFYSDLVESSTKLGREFQWDAILPQAGFAGPLPEMYKPHGATEEKWLAEWAAPHHAGAQAPPAEGKPEPAPADPSASEVPPYRERYITDADGRRLYRYY